MKSKLLFKLAISFAAVMLLFTFVLGAVFLTLFREHTIELNRFGMEETAVSIAETLSNFETGHMRRGEGGGYGAYLRFLSELGIAEVWVVDERLHLLTCGHGNHNTNYEELPDNAEQIVTRVFSGEITYGEEFSGLLGTPSLTVGVPILNGEEVVGAVLLHSPVSGIDAAVEQGFRALAVGAAVALLFAGIAALLLSYRFTRPLERMKAAVLQLGEGNYMVQTGITKTDEIGQLAHVLDELARRLQMAEEERKSLDKLRENFVTNVSHELRTPVAVLRGSLENLREGIVNDPEEISMYYNQMLSESCHLERLVNDLLDLSRLQDDGFQLQMQEADLCDIVWDVTRSIRRTAQGKNVAVTVTCPEEECIVIVDYGRIRQLLLILLDNAVKFSEENNGIEVALSNQEQMVLTVTDHGAGIEEEELPRIFERFHKTNNTHNKAGTGLGLAIAKEIAQRHHINISAKSGQGNTCFVLIFKNPTTTM